MISSETFNHNVGVYFEYLHRHAAHTVSHCQSVTAYIFVSSPPDNSDQIFPSIFDITCHNFCCYCSLLSLASILTHSKKLHHMSVKYDEFSIIVGWKMLDPQKNAEQSYKHLFSAFLLCFSSQGETP